MYDVAEKPGGVPTVATPGTNAFICFRLLYHAFQIRPVETNERSVGSPNHGSIHRQLFASLPGAEKPKCGTTFAKHPESSYPLQPAAQAILAPTDGAYLRHKARPL